MMLPLLLAALLGTALAEKTPEKTPEECAEDCTVAWYQCRQAVLMDMTYCATEYSSCLGYNPFKAGYVVPLACKDMHHSFFTTALPDPEIVTSSTSTTSTTSAPASVSTRSAQDAHKQQCLAKFRVCGARQDINRNTPCASSYSDCLEQPLSTISIISTINAAQTWTSTHSETSQPSAIQPYAIQPYAIQPSASQPYASQPSSLCAHRCVNAFYECQTVTNYVHCPSLIVECLGYNPFYGGRLNVEGIACANESTSAPTPTAPVIKDKCAKKCMDQYNACNDNPDVRYKAFCGMQIIQCLGYDPFKTNGLELPTACKPTTTPVQTPRPTQDACAKMCAEEMIDCRSQLGANRALCSSRYRKCREYASLSSPANSTLPASCVWNISWNVTTKAVVPPFRNVTTLPVNVTTLPPLTTAPASLPKNLTTLPPLTTAPAPLIKNLTLPLWTNFTKSESTMPAVAQVPESTPSASLQTPFGTIWVPTPTKSIPAVITAAAHHLEPVLPLAIFAAAAAAVVL